MSRRPTLSLVRSALWPAVAVTVILYFAGAAIVGQNGLLSLAGYRHQRAEHQAQLDALKAQEAQIAHHAWLLRPGHVDPDYAEEKVREQTGQIRPDEAILPTK